MSVRISSFDVNVQNPVQRNEDLQPLILLDLFAPAIRILSRTLFIRLLEWLEQEFGQEFKKNLKAYRIWSGKLFLLIKFQTYDIIILKR